MRTKAVYVTGDRFKGYSLVVRGYVEHSQAVIHLNGVPFADWRTACAIAAAANKRVADLIRKDKESSARAAKVDKRKYSISQEP